MKNKHKQKTDNTFLFKLTWRTSLFLFLLLAVLFLFYLSGNYQNFLDSTQLFVLFLCSIICIFLFLFSAAGILESIFLFFSTMKKRYWIYFACYVLSLILSGAFFVALRTISKISLGL